MGLLAVSCFPGSGSLVPESLGSLVPWSLVPCVREFLGSLVPWFLDVLVLWFSGCLVPWFPVLCRWISLAEAMENKSECLCFFDFVFFVWGVHSLSMLVEFRWFCGHFSVILRSRGALGSKMTPRGVKVEKGRKREGCLYPSAPRILVPF